jgi:hypothetical protein
MSKLKSPNRLDALKIEWTAATSEERSEFLAWALLPATAGAPPPRPPHNPIADEQRRLTHSGVTRIQAALEKRGWRDEDGYNKLGALMEELGGNKLDASIGMAINHGSRLQQDLINVLQGWLDTEESV